ncbi:cilia- and flagella-associated protein 53 [Cyclospora cayetanensis]|uniref:Cilia- and flagella-associated protein 53 n=1 Tax=Cyclospora cayetanensis TaxID=88456 RepID=A0A6P6RPM4_9EIME|nr:cilia- and flagella-associated protein 53 [Cyclospora cayetanensis]
MGKSRQAAVVGALLEQDMLRQREASLTAAADIVAEQRGLQLIASVVNRQNTAAADATLWRRVVEVRRQLSSGIHERRHKLKALLKLEYDQVQATLRQSQHNAALKKQGIIRRAAELKQKREQEQDKDDQRRLVERCQGQADLQLPSSKLLLQQVPYPIYTASVLHGAKFLTHLTLTLAENEIQIALKSRRQHQEAKDEKVFEAIWTEALNKKILRERSAVTMRQKRAEELRAALREQIASRQDNRLKEMERLKIENQEEAYRLKAEAESAVELRRQQHTAALQRRREMDAILILQLEQKHRRRMEEAALDR